MEQNEKYDEIAEMLRIMNKVIDACIAAADFRQMTKVVDILIARLAVLTQTDAASNDAGAAITNHAWSEAPQAEVTE